ncbi:MAG: pantoate--beta-alanine ligase [Athalassotoga sp.]|uniref:pantoate--beta-alanine ligase n=1 Tax=Athalassotoga sp. TaxID=2022597 RepID=UPI003D07DE64
MKTIKHVSEMVEISKNYAGKSVGFVPTMGALHAGHLSLVKEARKHNDIVVVSIFVNPAQFGLREDFGAYPRVLDKDQALLDRENVDYIFAPESSEMYPEGFSTSIHVANLTDYLCGYYRPGHFDGVALVVNKLLNMVKPTRAYFGQKDAQQFRMLKRMVGDLNMSVEMIEMPIVREPDGLALSSRNMYLSSEERKVAPMLHQAIKYTVDQIKSGRRDAYKIKREAINKLRVYPEIKVQYFEIVDEEKLIPISKITSKVIVAAAIYLGKTRLIDNEIVDV